MRPTQFYLLRCTERKPQLTMDGHPSNHKVHTTRDKPMWLPQPKLRGSRPVLRNKGNKSVFCMKKNNGIVFICMMIHNQEKNRYLHLYDI